MKRIATAGAVASFVVVMVGNLIANAGPQVQTIRAIPHTTNLGGVDGDDSGEVGDTIADAFTSISDMRDEADETVIGFDRFTCSMTSAEPATWHCYGTTTFNGAGDITYQGSFNPNGKSVLAITGGTGDYTGAGGWVVFKPRDDFPYEGVYHVFPSRPKTNDGCGGTSGFRRIRACGRPVAISPRMARWNVHRYFMAASYVRGRVYWSRSSR